MALIIEGGITIGGNISIAAEIIDPTTNLVIFYDAGNSMCYSGSGIQFNITYTGPNLTSYEQYGVLDIAGLTGGPWNSGFLQSGSNTIGWTSQGVASYWTMNANDNQYINSTFQQDGPSLNSPTYTILAVVRPQDFTQGAIVGGDQNTFYFQPNGGLDDGPSLCAGFYGPPVVQDTTTLFETNTWYCVSVTYDAITDTMKLYTNGVLVDTVTGAGAIDHPTGLFWGTLEGDLWFTGDMAVCMAWERVLGASEISQLSEVYLSRYILPSATSSIVYTNPYLGGPPDIFTVPEGVYSISAVAVGGGGGGTQDSYSPPGGDSVIIRNDNYVYVNTSYTGTTNTVVVDNATYPNIANVTANGSWIVGGTDIGGPNPGIPAWDLVTAVDTTDPANTVITIDKTISTTAGDQFFFYEAVVAAEGGYEINDSYYSSNPDLTSGYGPGPRAHALVTDGPYGQGGVVDWTDTWPIGGGGAGGYGIPGLAWNKMQAGLIVFKTSTSDYLDAMALSNNNLTVTGLIGINDAQVEPTILGTQTIEPGSKVMYSINISQTSGGIGYCGIGLATYGQNLWDYVGNSGNFSVGFYDDGRVFIDSSNVATYANFNEGGLIDIAVDTIAGKVWFRVSGGNWNAGGSANPATGVGGLDISAILAQGPVTLAASPYYDTTSSLGDVINITTTSYYVVPAGFTFVSGTPNAGGYGGGGAADYSGDPQQVQSALSGTGGGSGGGGGRYNDSGAGGGGTGLYGRGTNGIAGLSVDSNSNQIGSGGGGGSNNGITSNPGGQATPWNGGRGGWPGGGGGSATDYYDGGNGGALAYRNDYEVTPGEEYIVLVGVGGQGQNDGGSGANGAIRIVWPGNTRQFPSTDVGPDTP